MHACVRACMLDSHRFVSEHNNSVFCFFIQEHKHEVFVKVGNPLIIFLSKLKLFTLGPLCDNYTNFDLSQTPACQNRCLSSVVTAALKVDQIQQID